MATADIESGLSDTPASFENAAAVVRELLEQTAVIAGAFAVQVLLDGRTPGGPRSAHAVRVADDGVTYQYTASAAPLDSSQDTVRRMTRCDGRTISVRWPASRLRAFSPEDQCRCRTGPRDPQ